MNRKQLSLVWIVASGAALLLSSNLEAFSPPLTTTGTAAVLMQASTGSSEIPITTTSQTALKEIIVGRDLMERFHYQDAIPHFDKAIAEDKECAMAYLFRAASSPGGEMLDYLNKAVAASGKATEGERLVIEAQRAAMFGESDKSEQLFRKALALYPKDFRVRTYLGFALMNARNYEDGIKEVRRALEIEPRFALAYNALGYLESYAGNYPEAEKAFQKYTDLLPDEPNPYDSYGALLLKEGKLDESIKSYKKALEVDPTYYFAERGLTTAYALKGMASEALLRLQTMLDGSKDYLVQRTALNGLINVALLDSKYDKAMEYLKKRYELDEQRKDYINMGMDLNSMGTVQLVQSGVNTTRGTFLKSEKRSPGKVELAGAYFKEANEIIQKSNASQDVKDLARLEYIQYQAEVALHTLDLPTAKSKAEEFARLIGSRNVPALNKQAHVLIGVIALAEGRYQDAVTELNQADVEAPYVLIRLAEAYHGLGDAAKAKEYRQKVANCNDLSFDFALNRPKAMD